MTRRDDELLRVQRALCPVTFAVSLSPESSFSPSWLASRPMSLWRLIAADLCLGAAALFGIVLVTAPDHPTTTQGVIAWTLLVVLMILAVVLLVVVVVVVRRIMRRRADHAE